MNPGVLARLTRWLGLRHATGERARRSPHARKRHSARAALVCFVLAALALNAGAIIVLDELRPGVRDPEYARRVARYRARLDENPGRPMVLVIGSSRAAMGIRPAAWEEVRRDGSAPMLFNMSLLGGGPVMELMIARRAFADGLRPAVVLFEYWPPFFYSEHDWAEWRRVAPDRLSPIDRAIVRDYFPDPASAETKMWHYRWNPLSASRHRLLLQVVPRWLPRTKRIDWAWDEVDAWGWKMGFDLPPGLTDERAAMLGKCCETYRPLFANYRVSPSADRALREAVAVAREHGATVGFVYLPESSEFRGWYSPRVERLARDHLARISQELAVPVIDARTWMDDGLLVDGFHLSRIGAAEFTRKLGPAVAATFPEARP